jgi:hypothetical protein
VEVIKPSPWPSFQLWTSWRFHPTGRVWRWSGQSLPSRCCQNSSRACSSCSGVAASLTQASASDTRRPSQQLATRQLAQADSRSLTAVFSQVLLELLHVGNGEADGRDFRDAHGLCWSAWWVRNSGPGNSDGNDACVDLAPCSPGQGQLAQKGHDRQKQSFAAIWTRRAAVPVVQPLSRISRDGIARDAFFRARACGLLSRGSWVQANRHCCVGENGRTGL